MQNELEYELARAQGLESAGSLAEAASSYESIVERHPNLISAHLQLAAVWQRLDRYRAAHSCVLAAAASVAATRRWEALPFVTMRLLEFGEGGLIRELIKAADWNHPAVIRQSPILSQHLWLSDAYDDAIALIDQVSSRVTPNAALSYSRANALRFSGKMTEAAEELERCLALSPNYPFAHWTLAYHSPAANSGPRIDRIRRAMQATATDSVAQIHLNYALFKELDAAGDTDKAWQALATGAQLKRLSIDYDSNAEAASLTALRRFADEASLPPAVADSAGKHVPLFIVGLPRTGTTLLERILSGHPDVSTAGELGEFTYALSWMLDGFLSNPPEQSAVRRLSELDFPALGLRYLEKTDVHGRGRKFVVDKNPSNVFHAWAIARAMPSARMVCLLRDPMDACFSNFKELFSGSSYGYSYDLEELAQHHRSFAAIVACWQRRLPGQFMTVGYEQLVADPVGVTRSVLDFCGLAPREDIVDITRNITPVLTASIAQINEPIHTRYVGAWSKYEKQLLPLQASMDTL
jgi:tetratricopeptide (TPR) repeat protein